MKLNYVIDENDLKAVKGMDETAANAPNPRVILDIQNTLQQALQPIQAPQSAEGAVGPAEASAVWGKAANG